MRRTLTLGIHLALITFVNLACGVQSADTALSSEAGDTSNDQGLNEISSTLTAMASEHDFNRRVEAASRSLIGKPFVYGPLGEGTADESEPEGRKPRWSQDGFDCTTYVETVMAMAHAEDLDSFKSQMDRIRYRDDAPKISYLYRNHFTSGDWNPSNARRGFIKDVTTLVGHQESIMTATATIDRSRFMKHNHSQLNPPFEVEANVTLNYIPWANFFNDPDQITALATAYNEREQEFIAKIYAAREIKDPAQAAAAEQLARDEWHQHVASLVPQGMENHELMNTLPASGIVNVAAPGHKILNKEKTETITELNVSHQSLIVRVNGRVMIREASMSFRKVKEMPLASAIAFQYLNKLKKGLNVLELTPAP